MRYEMNVNDRIKSGHISEKSVWVAVDGQRGKEKAKG